MDMIMNFWHSLDTEKVTKYSHLIMLDLGKYNLKKLTKYDKEIEKYMEKITKLNNDANFWEVFTPEEDERYIRNTIKRESEKKKSFEIAKNMLAKNLDINLIADVTKLSKQEIMKLKEI